MGYFADQASENEVYKLRIEPPNISWWELFIHNIKFYIAKMKGENK